MVTQRDLSRARKYALHDAKLPVQSWQQGPGWREAPHATISANIMHITRVRANHIAVITIKYIMASPKSRTKDAVILLSSGPLGGRASMIGYLSSMTWRRLVHYASLGSHVRLYSGLRRLESFCMTLDQKTPLKGLNVMDSQKQRLSRGRREFCMASQMGMLFVHYSRNAPAWLTHLICIGAAR